jgi:hypothetical protein
MVKVLCSFTCLAADGDGPGNTPSALGLRGQNAMAVTAFEPMRAEHFKF